MTSTFQLVDKQIWGLEINVILYGYVRNADTMSEKWLKTGSNIQIANQLDGIFWDKPSKEETFIHSEQQKRSRKFRIFNDHAIKNVNRQIFTATRSSLEADQQHKKPHITSVGKKIQKTLQFAPLKHCEKQSFSYNFNSRNKVSRPLYPVIFDRLRQDTNDKEEFTQEITKIQNELHVLKKPLGNNKENSEVLSLNIENYLRESKNAFLQTLDSEFSESQPIISKKSSYITNRKNQPSELQDINTDNQNTERDLVIRDNKSPINGANVSMYQRQRSRIFSPSKGNESQSLFTGTDMLPDFSMHLIGKETVSSSNIKSTEDGEDYKNNFINKENESQTILSSSLKSNINNIPAKLHKEICVRDKVEMDTEESQVIFDVNNAVFNSRIVPTCKQKKSSTKQNFGKSLFEECTSNIPSERSSTLKENKVSHCHLNKDTENLLIMDPGKIDNSENILISRRDKTTISHLNNVTIGNQPEAVNRQLYNNNNRQHEDIENILHEESMNTNLDPPGLSSIFTMPLTEFNEDISEESTLHSQSQELDKEQQIYDNNYAPNRKIHQKLRTLDVKNSYDSLILLQDQSNIKGVEFSYPETCSNMYSESCFSPSQHCVTNFQTILSSNQRTKHKIVPEKHSLHTCDNKDISGNPIFLTGSDGFWDA